MYPRTVPTFEWDTAAAQAIVEAAGGRGDDGRRRSCCATTRRTCATPASSPSATRRCRGARLAGGLALGAREVDRRCTLRVWVVSAPSESVRGSGRAGQERERTRGVAANRGALRQERFAQERFAQERFAAGSASPRSASPRSASPGALRPGALRPGALRQERRRRESPSEGHSLADDDFGRSRARVRAPTADRRGGRASAGCPGVRRKLAPVKRGVGSRAAGLGKAPAVGGGASGEVTCA